MLFMHSFKLTFTYQLNDFPNTFPFDEKRNALILEKRKQEQTKAPIDGGTKFSFLSLTDAKEIKLSTIHH